MRTSKRQIDSAMKRSRPYDSMMILSFHELFLDIIGTYHKIIRRNHQTEGLELEVLSLQSYRSTFDLLLIGEAAAELLVSKPKSTMERPENPKIIWDQEPKRKAFAPISEKL